MRRPSGPHVACTQLPRARRSTPHAFLKYALRHSARLQGNCSDPDAPTALSLSPAEATALLPLKPRQCLLLLPDTFLVSNGGPFWTDNLYLKILRTEVVAEFKFLSAGVLGVQQGFPGVTASDLYVTNVTMHGEERGLAIGVALEEDRSNLLMKGALRTCL